MRERGASQKPQLGAYDRACGGSCFVVSHSAWGGDSVWTLLGDGGGLFIGAMPCQLARSAYGPTSAI